MTGSICPHKHTTTFALHSSGRRRGFPDLKLPGKPLADSTALLMTSSTHHPRKKTLESRGPRGRRKALAHIGEVTGLERVALPRTCWFRPLGHSSLRKSNVLGRTEETQRKSIVEICPAAAPTCGTRPHWLWVRDFLVTTAEPAGRSGPADLNLGRVGVFPSSQWSLTS